MTTPVLNAVTEKEFQQQVVALARVCGWRTYYTHDSRRSPFGFPDLCMVRPPRLIMAELKSERGKLSPQQIEWLADLRCIYAVEVYLWRPSDFDDIVAALAREAVT